MQNKNLFNPDFGLRLKEFREAKNKTIDQFAKDLRISRTALITYENGGRLPRLNVFQELARQGADINYLITGNPCVEKLNNELSELVTLFNSAEVAIKYLVLAILKDPNLKNLILNPKSKKQIINNAFVINNNFEL